jgi:hypothetical protein
MVDLRRQVADRTAVDVVAAQTLQRRLVTLVILF